MHSSASSWRHYSTIQTQHTFSFGVNSHPHPSTWFWCHYFKIQIQHPLIVSVNSHQFPSTTLLMALLYNSNSAPTQTMCPPICFWWHYFTIQTQHPLTPCQCEYLHPPTCFWWHYCTIQTQHTFTVSVWIATHAHLHASDGTHSHSVRVNWEKRVIASHPLQMAK